MKYIVRCVDGRYIAAVRLGRNETTPLRKYAYRFKSYSDARWCASPTDIIESVDE